MNHQYQYDPARALSAHKAQERGAWDRYLSAASMTEDDATYAAERADAMLEERRKRFPGPRFKQVEREELAE